MTEGTVSHFDVAGAMSPPRSLERAPATRVHGAAPGGCRVAIIGAGPYGLAIAAHLRAVGVETKVFGQVMSFWRNHMPEGMLLRSEWRGTHIADAKRTLTLDRYEQELGVQLSRRLPIRDFITYAEWFQRRGVPEVDARRVVEIEPDGAHFRLTLSDRETIRADRVVVAIGLAEFASRPSAFAAIPSVLAPHSCDVRCPSALKGMRVVVVGAGQSALESTALLHEAGAEVEVVARARRIRYLSARGLIKRYARPLEHILIPPGEVGPPGINWIAELPDLFRSLPMWLQPKVARRAIHPAGSAWLRPRLAGVPMTAGRTVVTAERHGDRLRLRLDDGVIREVDRAVLATGFHVDLDRITLLAPRLAQAVQRIGGSPRLGPGFESTVPGLHFVGAASFDSFGPLMRFVAGTGYTARAVTKHVAGAAALARADEL